MHDSSFWYQYSTVSPRGAREGPGGAQYPLAPPQIRLCIQYTHHGLPFVLQCAPVLFTDNASCQFVIAQYEILLYSFYGCVEYLSSLPLVLLVSLIAQTLPHAYLSILD